METQLKFIRSFIEFNNDCRSEGLSDRDENMKLFDIWIGRRQKWINIKRFDNKN